MVPTRDKALEILDEMIENENLKKHMYAVEAVVKAYAKKFNKDEKKWAIAALLHDADWEKHPKVHPSKIVEKLKEMNIDQAIIQAIASHGNNSEKYPTNKFTKRKSLLDKTLYACDELSGFIVACALVRPTKLEGMKVSSVKKKLKDKSFAANVSRDEIYEGAEDLGIELDKHIEFVIKAMQGISDKLGLEA